MQSHASLFLFSTLASIVNIALPIILVRLYPPGEIGVFKIFFLYLLSMPVLSFSSGITSGLPLWSGKKENGHVYLQQSFSLNLLLTLVIGLLGLLLYLPLKGFAFTATEYFAFVACTIFLLLTSYFDELFVAIGEVDKGGITLAGFEVVKALIFLFLAYKHYPLESLFVTYATVLMLKFAAGFIMLKPFGKNKLIWIETVKKEILAYSVPVSISNILSFFLDKVDQLILSFFVSKEMFAYYGIGCLVIPPLLILEQSVTRVALPKLSSHIHEPNKVKEIYQAVVADIALLNIPGAFGLMVFAKPIIVMLFGHGYENAVIFTRLFSLFYLTLIFPPDILLRSIGAGTSILKLNAIFAPISLILCLALSFHYQAYGTLVAFLLIRPFRTWAFLKVSKDRLGLSLSEFVPWKNLFRYLIISLGLSTLSIFTANFFSSEFQWFLIMGTIFFLSFVVLNFFQFKHLFRK